MKHKVSLLVFLCLFTSTVLAADQQAQKQSPWNFLWGLVQTVAQTASQTSGVGGGGALAGFFGNVISDVIGEPAGDDSRFAKLISKCHWGVYLNQVGGKAGLSGWLSLLLRKNQSLPEKCQVLFDIEEHLKKANPEAAGFQHLQPSMLYTCSPYLVKKVLSGGLNKIVYGSENIVNAFLLTGSQAEAAQLCGEMVRLANEAEVVF